MSHEPRLQCSRLPQTCITLNSGPFDERHVGVPSAGRVNQIDAIALSRVDVDALPNNDLSASPASLVNWHRSRIRPTRTAPEPAVLGILVQLRCSVVLGKALGSVSKKWP